jgi:hypothetical protein
MKILKWILGIVLVLVLLVLGLMAYMGMFSPIKVHEAQMGPFTVAYESFTGPYAQTGPVFAKVYNALKAEGINSSMGLGIYYDNPAEVPADKLRSDCGAVIDKKNLAKLKKIKVKTLAQKDSLVVEFPIRNIFSYMIGPMKAYPVLMKHAEEKGYKILMTYELYDEANGKMFFVMVVTKGK